MKDNNLSTLLGFKKNIPPKEGEIECDSPELNQMIGWDKAITELEQLSPDVERLAKILYQLYFHRIFSNVTPWDELTTQDREKFRIDAKSIISSIPEWVVRK